MNESQPFFKSGNLRVNILSENVRWIDFLAYSRVVRAKDGGWNHRGRGEPLWVELGLRPLAAGEFVTEWTRNSLNDAKPRTGDFRLTRMRSDQRAKVEAQCDEKRIEKCSENALNARLFQKYREGVDSPFAGPLLGYEIPLCATRAGQLRIDLLARASASDGLEIIELKQANGNDSPLMALVEGICYALQLWNCRKAFLRGQAPPELALTEQHFAKLRLTIAAPASYWKRWLPSDAKRAVREMMESILARVNAGALASLLARVNAGAPASLRLTLGEFLTIEASHLRATGSESSYINEPRAAD